VHKDALFRLGSCALALACAAACATTTDEAHRTHLGAVLDLPGGDVALASPEVGRTDDDRTRAQALLDEGKKKRGGGDLAGSRKDLEEALQLDASLARAHMEWALTAEGLGVEPELIAAHYQLGARLAPDDAQAQILAAAWAARQGDGERALELYQRAAAADAKNVEARARIGDLLATRGDLDGAIASFHQALELDGRSVPALSGLADAAEKAKKLDDAEAAHKALVELFPDVTVYRQRLVAFYKRTGQDDKARAADRALDKVDPGDTRKLRKLRR
jgi:tetratricopeptide (TPR) repeat protein